MGVPKVTKDGKTYDLGTAAGREEALNDLSAIDPDAAQDLRDKFAKRREKNKGTQGKPLNVPKVGGNLNLSFGSESFSKYAGYILVAIAIIGIVWAVVKKKPRKRRRY